MTGRWKGIFMFVFQIIALVMFFKAPSSIQDSYFFFMVFGGGSVLGIMIGSMIDGDL